jgi:hypothetical protein
MTTPSPERAKSVHVPVRGSAMIWKVAVDAFAGRQTSKNRHIRPAERG